MSISLEEFARRGGAAQSAVDLAIQRADLVARLSYAKRAYEELVGREHPRVELGLVMAARTEMHRAELDLEGFDRALAGRAA